MACRNLLQSTMPLPPLGTLARSEASKTGPCGFGSV